jgi:hypothetical protein
MAITCSSRSCEFVISVAIEKWVAKGYTTAAGVGAFGHSEPILDDLVLFKSLKFITKRSVVSACTIGSCLDQYS